MDISTRAVAPQPSSDTDLSDLLGDSDASAQSADNRAVALDLARRGFAVFPITRKEHGNWTPIQGWQAAATCDADTISRWWEDEPNARVGLPAGKANGVAVLDIDRKNGKDGYAELRRLGFDPDSLSPVGVRTPSGGCHLFFAHTEGLKNWSRGEVAPGLDVRTEGGFVVAPGSFKDGGSYTPLGHPLGSVELPPFPEALIPPAKRERAHVAVLDVASAEQRAWAAERLHGLADALAAMSEGGRNATLNEAAMWAGGAAAQGGMIDRETAHALLWAACERNGLPRREFESTFRSGWDAGLRKPIFDFPREITADDFDDLPALPASSFPAVWGATIQRSSKGEPLPTLTNASIFLASINETEDLGLRYNLMRQWEESLHGEVDDATIGVLRIKIERAGMRRIGKDLTGDAVTQVARQHSYHPVRDYLSALMHDGEKRIDTWLSNYLGSEDTPLTRAIGRAFLIAMVARVERPGCKHDSMLMLAGDQGIGKSTACSILAGEWFGDKLPSLADNAVEASRYIQGKWLVEAGELEALRKAEAETLKAFISCQDDEGRMPYGRRYRRLPRQTVLVGTTNSTDYLRDTTGNRRYWPVQCGKSLDLDGLKRDRDQLFAEARDAFNAGVPWHLSDEMEKQARVAQEAVREQDPWEEAVREYLDRTDFDGNRRDKIKASDCLTFLGIPTAHQGMRESKRIANVLRALRWERKHSEGGKVWVRT